MKSVIRFKYHDGYITNRMKLTRLIWQSCNILVGLAIDELNFERGGEVDGMGRYVQALDLSPGFGDFGRLTWCMPGSGRSCESECFCGAGWMTQCRRRI